jgi:hypothetical protein
MLTCPFLVRFFFDLFPHKKDFLAETASNQPARIHHTHTKAQAFVCMYVVHGRNYNSFCQMLSTFFLPDA